MLLTYFLKDRTNDKKKGGQNPPPTDYRQPAPSTLRTDFVPEWHGTLAKLAAQVADMRFDRQAYFFGLLVKELQKQSTSENNKILSARLYMAAHNIEVVKYDFVAASKI